jgi:triphosphoribosyl-dephospho-CoA synthase
MIGKQIAQWVQLACIHEVCASKPGNVSRYHDFSDAGFEDFLISAVAIGPAFENIESMSIGRIFRQAVEDTHRLVRTNTNLGLILLLAPLAKAAWDANKYGGEIRQSLATILKSLTIEDARMAYQAIRLVQPAGLGIVEDADIAEEPSISLLEAMTLAKDRDSIAREYVTNYSITFDIGFPALIEALSQTKKYSSAVVHAFLSILSRVPDTLIARKNGIEAAIQVSHMANKVLSLGSVFTSEGKMELKELHNSLSDASHSLNPGTTADLTAAAVFLSLLENDGHSGIHFRI